MIGNVGGLIATWSYLPNDGPNYRIGSGLNVAALSVIFLITVGLGLWMKRDNRRRDHEQHEAKAMLSGMSLSEIQDLEYKHPLFRWKS